MPKEVMPQSVGKSSPEAVNQNEQEQLLSDVKTALTRIEGKFSQRTTLPEFSNRLKDWTSEMIGNGIKYNEKYLRESAKRRGKLFRHNLHRTPDGKILDATKQAKIPEGLEESSPEQDWPWETVEQHNKRHAGWSRPRPDSDDEYSYWKKSFDRYSRDSKFIETLLDNWNKVEELMDEAKKSGITFSEYDYDNAWKKLMELLGMDDAQLADHTSLKIAFAQEINKMNGIDEPLSVGY